MNVAISVWEGKVSPVFDTASRLLVLQMDEHEEKSRFETYLDEHNVTRKCARVQGLGVHVLICGAISLHFRQVLGASGIQVIPWISGPAEEVLDAFKTGHLEDSRYRMPGCDIKTV
jgi:predicted Fe-Mo cluster-binding NifX family protein